MSELTPTDAAAAAAFDRITQALAPAGVTRGRWMSMPTLYLAGKAIAGLWRGAMVFKLAGEAHAEALGLPGSVLFDPSEMGHAMKAWVQVSVEHADRWPDFAEAAAHLLQPG